MKKYNLTSSYPIWIHFISFSCPISLAGPSSIRLSRSGESGNHCLVLIVRGNASSSFSFSRMLAVDLSQIAIILRYFSLMPSLFRVLNHEWMLDFFEQFFCTYWNDYMVLVFSCAYVVNTFIDFLFMSNHPYTASQYFWWT